MISLASDPEVSSLLFKAIRRVDNSLTTLAFSTGSLWATVDEHLALHHLELRERK